MSHAGFVAIVGRPNSGKSTLLNQILGTKLSIVTPKAQTTRERVLGIYTEEDKQIIFIDTPGIHRAKEGGINEYMVHEAKEAMEDTSVIWYLVDPDSAVKHEGAVIDLLARSKAPVFILMNKSDLRRESNNEFAMALHAELKSRGIEVERVIKLSGRYGEGVKELLSETWKFIPESPFYFEDPDQISDRPVKFFVAEKIREQLYLCLGQEVPYSCAVDVERFDENARPPRIEATIYVERDSQKGMVVGKGGQKIKEIGQNARLETEEFLGHPIFLGLRVKVLKDWTKNAEALKRLGYNLPKQRPGKSKAGNSQSKIKSELS